MPNSPGTHDDDLRRRGLRPPRADADRCYNRRRRAGDGTLAIVERMRSTARWKAVRDVVRRRDPLCVLCLARGLTTPTDDVDHLVSARECVESGRPKLFYASDNCRGVCRPCHAREGSR